MLTPSQKRILLGVGAAVFTLALPLALVLTNIRILSFDADYWQRSYVRNEVDEWTGMSFGELAEATRQVQDYFRGGPPVSMVVEKVSLRPGNPRWGPEPLFNERERNHLADVRDLLQGAMGIQEVTVAYLVGAALLLLAFGRAAGARMLARWTTIASLATLSLFAVLGLLALGDFSSFWTRFHELSFDNDLWLLEWETDYMIRFWPAAFWFGAVMDVVVRSVAAALLLLVLAHLYLRVNPRRR